MTVTIKHESASGPGALPGYKMTCSECGSVFTTSLSENEARLQAAEHEMYHLRKKTGQKRS